MTPTKDELLKMAQAAGLEEEFLVDPLSEHRFRVFSQIAAQALTPTVQEPLGYLEIDDIESQREYPHNCRHVNLWHEGDEGMAAIYTTPPAQPAVPDAIHHTDLSESLEYIQGWNECRQAMLEMMK